MRNYLIAICVVSLLLCWGTVSEAVIYVGDSSGTLGTLDPGTGNVNVIGNMGLTMTDIAMDSSGNLWGITFSDLYTVNTTTAARTLVGSLGSSLNALTFVGSTLYAAGPGTTQLFTVNTGTGAATSVFNTGFASSGDLEYFGGKLYLSADVNDPSTAVFDDSLIEIDLGGAITATNLGGLSHDLVYGLATNGGTLYGIAGTDTFTIDPATMTIGSDVSYAGQGLGPAFGASTVPEPASFLIWSLFGACAIGLGWRRRRKA